jgi:uncharacterized membrane protein YeaQ/YmgE (transglycosylase-associated protein family)
MTIADIVILVLVAGICGSLARSVVGYSHGGCLASVVLGFVGALLGTWLARLMKLPEPFPVTIGNQPFPILWSIIGATLFVAVLSALVGRRRPVA